MIKKKDFNFWNQQDMKIQYEFPPLKQSISVDILCVLVTKFGIGNFGSHTGPLLCNSMIINSKFCSWGVTSAGSSEQPDNFVSIAVQDWTEQRSINRSIHTDYGSQFQARAEFRSGHTFNKTRCSALAPKQKQCGRKRGCSLLILYPAL